MFRPGGSTRDTQRLNEHLGPTRGKRFQVNYGPFPTEPLSPKSAFALVAMSEIGGLSSDAVGRALTVDTLVNHVTALYGPERRVP